jgi:hypothetical protein
MTSRAARRRAAPRRILRRTLRAAAVIAAALPLAAAHGQDAGDQAARERISEPTSPGPGHDRLAPMVGRWDQTVRLYGESSAAPVTSRTTAEYRWILGGRFLEGTSAGEMLGAPFAGRELTGYDDARGEYVSVWIDSLTTSFLIARGRYDAGAAGLIMEGTRGDPGAAGREQPFRTITKMLDENHMVRRMYTLGADGTETKVLEVESRRIYREEP